MASSFMIHLLWNDDYFQNNRFIIKSKSATRFENGFEQGIFLTNSIVFRKLGSSEFIYLCNRFRGALFLIFR